MASSQQKESSSHQTTNSDDENDSISSYGSKSGLVSSSSSPSLSSSPILAGRRSISDSNKISSLFTNGTDQDTFLSPISTPSFGKSYNNSYSHKTKSSTIGGSNSNGAATGATPSLSTAGAAAAAAATGSSSLELPFMEEDTKKLQLDSLGLYGRDEEINLLTQAFEQNTSSQAHSTTTEPSNDNYNNNSSTSRERMLVLISGMSGTGKSKLTESTLRPLVEAKGGLYVQGKFDQNMTHQPYSGIASACAELCGCLLALRQKHVEEYQKICHEIQTSLGSELELLIKVIPMLEEIFDIPFQQQQQQQLQQHHQQQQQTTMVGKSFTESSMSTSGAKNQIYFAFRRFMRIATRYFKPLVMVLDDLQWADSSSLGLLEAMMSDPNTKFMVVGVYRSNEVIKGQALDNILLSLETNPTERLFSIIRIEIKDLDLDGVHSILQHALESTADDMKTRRLAEICLRKTNGNPFFVLEFLLLLRQRNLLQMTHVKKIWTWDERRIEESAVATDNVIALIKSRMVDLPPSLQEILRVASCLGSSFEEGALRVPMRTLFGSTENDNILLFQEQLQRLETEGMLIKSTGLSPRYKWAHDKIHEAAMALIPINDRKSFRRSIGKSLEAALNKGGPRLESIIFVLTDLLNDAEQDSLDLSERISLAQMNAIAGEKAVKVSAFDSAANYARMGTGLLPHDVWNSHSDLALKLYSIGARAEEYRGNFDIMEGYCMKVINQENKSLVEKSSVYHAWISGLMRQNKVREAANVIFDVLAKNGCRFPRNSTLGSISVMSNFAKIKATMSSRKPSEFGMIKDEKMIELMHFLDVLSMCMYLEADDRIMLVNFRMMNWTVKYGNCMFSPKAFTFTGIILTGVLDDLQGGAKYGEHALALLGDNPWPVKGSTFFFTYAFLIIWVRPLAEILDPLLEAYDAGLKYGDAESICWSLVNLLQLKLYCGTQLIEMQNELVSYRDEQLTDVKNEPALKFIQPVHQAVMNLMGEDNEENCSNLSGKALSNEDREESLNNNFFKPAILVHDWLLLAYFGEYKKHADQVLEVGYDFVAKNLLAAPENMINTYLSGLSCFVAGQETGKKQYIKVAELYRAKLKKWIKRGNPNLDHYNAMLDAEHYALKGKHASAIKSYEAADVFATRDLYYQDVAIANERLGEFHLHVMKNMNEAEIRLRKSLVYWGKYGAIAKCRHLVKKHPTVLVNKNDEPQYPKVIISRGSEATASQK